MREWAAAIACLTGCNAVFGIDPVIEKMPDAPVDPCTLHADDPRFHDEDGDGLDNACDDCPGIYNPQQQDGDGDHIGDACDPHPAAAGDTIVAAEFFDGPTYAWTPNAASQWQLTGGSLLTTAAPAATHAMLTLTATVAQPTIELGFTVVTYSDPAMMLDQRVSVTLNAPANIGECRFVSKGFGLPLDAVQTYQNNNYGGVADLPGQLAAGQASTWRFTFDHLAETCTINGTVEVAKLVDNSMPTLDVPITNTTIQVDYHAISLQYALVYATGT